MTPITPNMCAVTNPFFAAAQSIKNDSQHPFADNLVSVRSSQQSLNRFGNTFQDISAKACLTRPGMLSTHPALYNPLNKHGNTFQGIFGHSSESRPGSFYSVSAATESAVNVAMAQPAITDCNVMGYEDSNEGCDLDAFIFDDHTLFCEEKKSEELHEEMSVSEEEKTLTKEFRSDYYTLTWLD
nr:hypothetical protein [uncultured Enterobacter sp.]